MIDADIEVCRPIQRAGHEILPEADREFEGAACRKTCFRFFKLLCAAELGIICVTNHAMKAVEKMGCGRSCDCNAHLF